MFKYINRTFVEGAEMEKEGAKFVREVVDQVKMEHPVLIWLVKYGALFMATGGLATTAYYTALFIKFITG